MYRRTLAASWQLIPGELNADECIEDIFAGGDGWCSGTNRGAKSKSVKLFDPGNREASDSDSLSQLSGGASTPALSVAGDKPAPSLLLMEPLKDGKRKGYALSMMTGRTKLTASSGRSKQKEVDELEARDDLVSWRMPGPRISKR
jgi:hypothetical protein